MSQVWKNLKNFFFFSGMLITDRKHISAIKILFGGGGGGSQT